MLPETESIMQAQSILSTPAVFCMSDKFSLRLVLRKFCHCVCRKTRVRLITTDSVITQKSNRHPTMLSFCRVYVFSYVSEIEVGCFSSLCNREDCWKYPISQQLGILSTQYALCPFSPGISNVSKRWLHLILTGGRLACITESIFEGEHPFIRSTTRVTQYSEFDSPVLGVFCVMLSLGILICGVELSLQREM